MEPETSVLPMPLTEAEQIQLKNCESVIGRGLETVFEVGLAFKTIVGRKLYRETCSTMEEYFKKRWGLSRSRVYQLMDGADTYECLSTNVDNGIPLPTNEAQTRALNKAPKERQSDFWEKAVEKNNGNVPTAKQVVQVIEAEFKEITPKSKPESNTEQTRQAETEKLRDVHERVGLIPRAEEEDTANPPKRIGLGSDDVSQVTSLCCIFCLRDDCPVVELNHVGICQSCAENALQSLDSSFWGHKTRSAHCDDEQTHFYTRDRMKIHQAGFQQYRCNWSDKALLIHTERGSWKGSETFLTKVAMKARIEELETDPMVIFDSH